MPATPIARALLRHFDAHRRDLPWRETSDPYAVWVSEVMLQQTRVDTARPYYRRWMQRFPTVESLADAELDDVLHEWQGLGYYSRARNLHRAARMVRERHAGDVPREASALRGLPGVGEYTAGAIASIAFGEATPAVDGNVRRVLSRLYDLESPTPTRLRSLAAGLVPRDRPGDFNQALMELGATVCSPRAPACPACPVARWCEARRLGVQERRPRPKRTPRLAEEDVATVVVAAAGALLLARRPENGLLGGLWEFPERDRLDALEPGLLNGARDAVELEPIRHVFSHKVITYRPVLVRGAPPGAGGIEARGEAGAGGVEPRGPAGAGDVAWARPERLPDFAMPVAQRKIAALALDSLRAPASRDGGMDPPRPSGLSSSLNP